MEANPKAIVTAKYRGPLVADRVKRSLRIRMEMLREEMKREAVRQTSGTVSTAELAAMGHPFSRRRPGTLPRLPINLQTGKLQKSLRVMPRIVRGEPGFQLQFMAPYSKFVLRPYGTTVMVARGFWAAMRESYKSAEAKVRRLKVL
jgi:hypothetical protein